MERLVRAMLALVSLASAAETVIGASAPARGAALRRGFISATRAHDRVPRSGASIVPRPYGSE